ncbi:hypothetical protein MKX01_022896 [Papaver californicum]|nr:hypothetical protein MKX01_022896 [Papaver californicum]
MALNLSNTWFPSPPLFCHPSPRISRISTCKFLCFSIYSTTSTRSYNIKVKSSSSSASGKGNEIPEESYMNLLGDELINRISNMKDADEVLEMISEKYQKDTGVVGTSNCCMIINSALERGNILLALSIFSAMRSSSKVPFGKFVRCPSCMIAVAVAQPQHGSQIASCAKCRYQHELVSGDIVSIESEEIRISSCRTQHGYFGLGKGA